MGTKRTIKKLDIPNKKFVGHWSQGLLASMQDESLQVFQDDKIIIIKDKYPKAKYHYLVLSKENITCLKQVKYEHLDLLKHMEKISLDIFQKQHPKIEFKAGFHSVPSMSRLHLHVISQDFISPCLKTKKHWNSFTSKFFVPISDIIQKLEETKTIKLIQAAEAKELLDRGLQCHKCNFECKTMPQLKKHLENHMNP